MEFIGFESHGRHKYKSMLIHTIKQYHLSDSDLSFIEANLDTIIMPFISELSDDEMKVYNTLNSGERVYTIGMRDKALELFKWVYALITDKLTKCVEELPNTPETASGLFLKPKEHMSSLIRHYELQLSRIEELVDMFTVEKNC